MEVEEKRFGRYVHHDDVFDVDIFNHTSASAAALETEAYVCSKETAVCDLDILHST